MQNKFPTPITSITTLFSVKFLKSDQRGFSLLQMTLALGVFLIASASTMHSFTRALGVTTKAKYYTEAIQVANAQMEAIKNTDFGDIVTDFPDGVSQLVQVVICHNGETISIIHPALEAHVAHGDTLGLCNPGDDAGITWLPEGATWTVTYPNGTTANPLAITLTVSWLERGQTQSIQLATEVASL